MIRLLPLLLLAGCAAPACRPMLSAELFFGLTDDREFNQFLDANVTPRFPDGLTVLNAAGRWRAPDGRLTQEHARLVIIIAPQTPETIPRLQAIRTEYKSQFHQQSVGMALTDVCADF